MADVGAGGSSFHRASAWMVCVLAVTLSTSTYAELAQFHIGNNTPRDSSYYLTVTVTKSHVPNARLSNVLAELLTSQYEAATLQVELDIEGGAKFTTVAHAFERQGRKSWVSRALRKDGQISVVHGLENYNIINGVVMHPDDIVTLGAIYSATHHRDVIDIFKATHGQFTYSGVASRAVRAFTRSNVQKEARTHLRQSAQQLTKLDCVIFAFQSANGGPTHRGDSIGRPQVCGAWEGIHGPSVELKITSLLSIFPDEQDTDLLHSIDSFLDRSHQDRVNLIADAETTGTERDALCVALREALDQRLVPIDRNLALLGTLSRMGFDPANQSPNDCWSVGLRELAKRYGVLRLGSCASENARDPEALEACELVGDFNLVWRGVASPETTATVSATAFKWTVRPPGSSGISGKEGMDELLQYFKLVRRYGDFRHSQGEWIGVGGIHDQKRKCLFSAEIGISVSGESDLLVHNVRVDAKPNAQVGDTYVRAARPPWGETELCRHGTAIIETHKKVGT